MSSDRKQFRRAVKKLETLRNERAFSLAPETGAVAILYSLCSIEADGPAADRELAVFKKEAEEIDKNTRDLGRYTDVIEGINEDSLGYVVTNPDFSDIIMIGHGNFSNVFTDNDDRIDWLDISKMTTHLKLGTFVQRFCGNYMRDLSVPLGLFAVADPANILAPSGVSYDPVAHPEHEDDLRPIDIDKIYNYDCLKLTHPKQALKAS